MNNYFKWYFIIINVLGFIIVGLDKNRAIHKKWRIKENTILFIGLLGGATGVVLSMTMFRHKTRHKLFFIGMPICSIAYFGILIFFM